MYSDAIAEHLGARLGAWFVPVAFAWLLLVPAVLVAAAAWWWRRPHAPAAPILLLGVGTPGQEAAVHVTNFILWPTAAAALLRFRAVSGQTPLT